MNIKGMFNALMGRVYHNYRTLHEIVSGQRGRYKAAVKRGDHKAAAEAVGYDPTSLLNTMYALRALKAAGAKLGVEYDEFSAYTALCFLIRARVLPTEFQWFADEFFSMPKAAPTHVVYEFMLGALVRIGDAPQHRLDFAIGTGERKQQFFLEIDEGKYE